MPKIGPTTKYALVGPDETVATIQANIDPTVGTKPGWRWLPFELIVKDCGSDQVREPTVDRVEADRVVREQIVRDLSSEEIAARTAALRAEAVNKILNQSSARLVRLLWEDVRGKPISDEEWLSLVERIV